jgi:DNA-binding transcriptional regulator YiaG
MMTPPMAKNFDELRAKMSPESRARVAARVKETLENMSLDQLRAARELTQESLAELLHIKQASISKMERRTDMYIGTLSRFIEAMGGQLEIRANFPEGSVRITQFSAEPPAVEPQVAEPPAAEPPAAQQPVAARHQKAS